MDLQSLTAQQLELTLKLCDILAIEDFSVGAAVLSSSNWNLEAALNDLQISAPPPAPQLNTLPSEDSNYNYDDGQNENYEPEEYENEQQYQYLFNQKKRMFEEQYASLLPLQKTLSEPNKEIMGLEGHRLLAKDSRAHRNEYLSQVLAKSELICNKLLSAQKQDKYHENRRKIENNRQFINYLYLNYKPKINFTFGTFFLNLTRAYLEDKFLLVYIHSVKPEVENKFKKVVELILRQKEIANFVNDNCITYGMFDNSDDYQTLQKHLPLKELPAFALFKLSKSNRTEQFISAYKISAQDQIFMEWAAESMNIKLQKKEGSHDLEKTLKEEVIKQEMMQKKEEEHTKAQAKQQQQYIAHRDIRHEQDQLWAELQKTYKQKKQLSFDRKEQIKQDEEELTQRKQAYSHQIQPESGPSVIEIRFRMPVSGESKARRFLLQDKIAKLFTYVDCFCRDEFEEKFNDFDLRQSFPQLSLAGKKDKIIAEVFEGSSRENIVVREM